MLIEQLAEDEILEELASYGEEVGAGPKKTLIREVKEKAKQGDRLLQLKTILNERRSDRYSHSVVLSSHTANCRSSKRKSIPLLSLALARIRT